MNGLGSWSFGRGMLYDRLRLIRLLSVALRQHLDCPFSQCESIVSCLLPDAQAGCATAWGRME